MTDYEKELLNLQVAAQGVDLDISIKELHELYSNLLLLNIDRNWPSLSALILGMLRWYQATKEE